MGLYEEENFERFNSETHKFEGKLQSLVEIFQKTYPLGDDLDLKSQIWLLQQYNWNPKAVELALVLDENHCDSLRVVDLLKEALDAMPNENLSENDKLDRVLLASRMQYSRNGVENLKPIVDFIKNDSLSGIKNLWEFKSKEANEFAKLMGHKLSMARKEGFISTRQIAKYFNDNNIKSALGGKWSASQVVSLLKRRQNLGLENVNLSDDLSKKEHEKFLKSMGKHLKSVEKEGIKGLKNIAERFNELGVKTKTGKEWSYVNVHKLIKERQGLGLE